MALKNGHASRTTPGKPTSVSGDEAFRQAITLYGAGKLPEAAQYLRAILKAVPGHFDTLHLLGVIAAREGDHDGAADLLGKAVNIAPSNAEAHHNLGHALSKLSRFEDAAAQYARVVELQPDHVDGHFRLGVCLESLKRLDGALAAFDATTRLKPDHANAHHHAGLALAATGRLDPALDRFKRVIALRAGFAEAHYNLGLVLHRLGRLEDAADSLQQAAVLAPNDAAIHNDLGATLHGLGRTEDAIIRYRRAIEIRPAYPEAFRNLGLAFNHIEQLDQAIASYRQSIDIDPGYMQAHLDLGIAYAAQRRWDEAITSYQRALALAPNSSDAHYALALAWSGKKQFDASLASCRRSLELRPDQPGALSHAVLVANRMADWTHWDADARSVAEKAGRISLSPFPLLAVLDDPAALRRAASRPASMRSDVASPPFHHNAKRIHGRVRLAYVSADFRKHAVAYLSAGLFECHDRSRFETHAFSIGPHREDHMRRRLERAFDVFDDTARLSDLEIARELHRREIDIVIDLMGHTKGSRPNILGYRPAPIQVTYLGYPGTTGADFIDYILVDRFVAPPEHQPHFSEKLVHLPDSYQVNDRSRAIAARAPSRSECGLPEKGFVFCSFNNSYKITPAIFEIWMRLLRSVPGSALWLLADNRWVEANLRREAIARGVEASRLVFAPRMDLTDHLARHSAADLFLDTLPYNAHTTASDALWAGLPVLTCAGKSFAARVAGSLLHAVGLPELVTHSLADYETVALKLAAQPTMLREIKTRLSANRLTLPLFDTDRSRRHIEAAYMQMCELWQRGEPPRSFAVNPL